MCGIGGVWGGTTIREPERLAQIFGELLAHRGPDGQGFLSIDGSGECRLARSPSELGREDLIGLLVHRRLSIIDLTTGDQPMGMTEAGAWILFNGEIYNYRELRAHLQSNG